jgi:L-fuconolactonase
MTEELDRIRRPFGPADLAPLLRENGVDGTVVVQARTDIEETRELLALARGTGFLLGVVAWVDLTDADVASTLRELASPELVGIRHPVHDEADADWLLRPDVQRGIGAVADAGLVYDFLVRTRELPAAVETARRFPEARFVVDHLAKPPVASGRLDEWKRALAPLGELGNVHCKLSGLVTEADWEAWTPDDLVEPVRHALAVFGPERCLFGSDWPVCLLAAGYRRVLDALLHALGGPDPAVLGETAVRVYRLERSAAAASSGATGLKNTPDPSSPAAM